MALAIFSTSIAHRLFNFVWQHVGVLDLAIHRHQIHHALFRQIKEVVEITVRQADFIAVRALRHGRLSEPAHGHRDASLALHRLA